MDRKRLTIEEYVEVEEEIGAEIEVGASNSRKRPGIFAIHWRYWGLQQPA